MSKQRNWTRRTLLQQGAMWVSGTTGVVQQPVLRAAEDVSSVSGTSALQPHHHPAAKQLIVVFLTGGVSHVDTFNYCPALAKDAGKSVTTAQLRANPQAQFMPSPFRFRQHGQSGMWISELFPQLATVADELCVINSMHTDIVEHFQAALAMHTGSATIPLPSLGSWLSYGLGTCNENLPPYVVFAEHLPYGGAQVWDNGFLPPWHQGVRIIPGREPIPHLTGGWPDGAGAQRRQRYLDVLNRRHSATRAGDDALSGRMQSFATARGMMQAAPVAFDTSHETQQTLTDYVAHEPASFGWQCLVARRLIEQGVRVVEIVDSGASNNWDAHDHMDNHRPKAQRVDQPLTALLNDLRQRGLLDSTLVAICTEFGRTPTTFNGKGREHYAAVFSSLLAGAGVRGGVVYGETDPHGMAIVNQGVHVHDYHATLLHLLGIDHQRLTYRYSGRDYRLTDVFGQVIAGVIA